MKAIGFFLLAITAFSAVLGCTKFYGEEFVAMTERSIVLPMMAVVADEKTLVDNAFMAALAFGIGMFSAELFAAL